MFQSCYHGIVNGSDAMLPPCLTTLQVDDLTIPFAYYELQITAPRDIQPYTEDNTNPLHSTGIYLASNVFV